MSSEIRIWTLDLDRPAGEAAAARAMLAAAELRQADRFRDPRLGARFAVCRAALRRILGRQLDADPASLDFMLTPYGKPELVNLGTHDLHFNVTHSGGRAIIAVRRGGPLGVDIERIRPDFATEAIAARFFSPREHAALRRFSEAERAPAFFRCWTRKEAFIKAIGEGMSFPLDAFEVTLDEASPAVRAIHGDVERGGCWTLRNLPAPPGFVAALAVEAPEVRLGINEDGAI